MISCFMILTRVMVKFFLTHTLRLNSRGKSTFICYGKERQWGQQVYPNSQSYSLSSTKLSLAYQKLSFNPVKVSISITPKNTMVLLLMGTLQVWISSLK